MLRVKHKQGFYVTSHYLERFQEIILYQFRLMNTLVIMAGFFLLWPCFQQFSVNHYFSLAFNVCVKSHSSALLSLCTEMGFCVCVFWLDSSLCECVTVISAERKRRNGPCLQIKYKGSKTKWNSWQWQIHFVALPYGRPFVLLLSFFCSSFKKFRVKRCVCFFLCTSVIYVTYI